MNAANESEFYPPVFLNPEFTNWVARTATRLRMVSGTSEGLMQRAICWEGVPPPEWAAGFLFAMSETARAKRAFSV